MLLLNNKNNIIIIKHWNHSIIDPPVGPGKGFVCDILLQFVGFPSGSDGKESACNAGDLGFIPMLRKPLGEGNSYPLQHFCLENSMDRGAWWATVCEVEKSWTRLSDQHFHFPILCLVCDKGMGVCLIINKSISQICQNWLARSNRYGEALGIISTVILKSRYVALCCLVHGLNIMQCHEFIVLAFI